MTKKRRRVYAPRRIIMSDEIGRIKEFLEFECFEAVSDFNARVNRRPVARAGA
jgi:hypothetical protein